MSKFTVVLDGIERELKFGLRAIKAIEDECGVSVADAAFIQGHGIGRLMVMLWAGLLHEDKKLKADSIFELVEKNPKQVITDCTSTIWDAYNHFWGIDKIEPEEKKTESKKIAP